MLFRLRPRNQRQRLLSAAGVPVDGLDPRTLSLFCQGVEQPLFVDGEQDGSFDDGDEMLFISEINTIPGMTQTSLLPDAARAAGIDFPARRRCG